MRCTALCLTAFLAAPAVAQDYSYLCATPANYQGGAMYDYEISTAVTCDQTMGTFTTGANTLAGKDFSSAFSCPAEAYNVKNTVNIVASYCCGTGDAASRRSACWADYSHVCADPSSYTPLGEYHSADETDTNTAVSCDQIMDFYTHTGLVHWDIDFSSVFDCTGKHPSAIEAVRAVAAVGRVGGRQRRQREHRGVLRSDHGLCYFSRASLGRRRLFERLNCGGVLRRQRLRCHHGHPFLRVHLLRLRQLRLPLRHRRLRHFGRPRRFGGRCGVRFRRSLGISLKGPLRDVPPYPSAFDF